MPKILIRPVTPDDAGAIAAIYAPAVTAGTATFELEPPSIAEMARRIGDLQAAGFPYLVGECDGTIAGYAYAAAFRARPAYRFTVENSIYIAQGRQRSGLGRALLTQLIDACAARGFRQMIAVIGDSSQQAASIAFHAQMGFRTIGTLDAVGFKFGRWLDSVYMQRALGET